MIEVYICQHVGCRQPSCYFDIEEKRFVCDKHSQRPGAVLMTVQDWRDLKRDRLKERSE